MPGTTRHRDHIATYRHLGQTQPTPFTNRLLGYLSGHGQRGHLWANVLRIRGTRAELSPGRAQMSCPGGSLW